MSSLLQTFHGSSTNHKLKQTQINKFFVPQISNLTPANLTEDKSLILPVIVRNSLSRKNNNLSLPRNNSTQLLNSIGQFDKFNKINLLLKKQIKKKRDKFNSENVFNNTKVFLKEPCTPNMTEIKGINFKLFASYVEVEQTINSYMTKKSHMGMNKSINVCTGIVTKISSFLKILKIVSINDFLKDNFYKLFNTQKLNKLYQQLLSTLIIVLTYLALLISYSHENTIDKKLTLANGLHDIFNCITKAYYILFSKFVFDELNIEGKDEVDEEEIRRFDREMHGFNNTQCVKDITKNVGKSMFLLKNIIDYDLRKQSTDCPFSITKSLQDLIKLNENSSFQNIMNIILYTWLYSLLRLPNEKARNRSTNNIFSVNNGSWVIRHNGKIRKNDNLGYYLPHIGSNYTYTWVLDWDETWISYFEGKHFCDFFVRPHCLRFWKELYELYEIVIFTAGKKGYADKILDKIDPKSKYIKYRLYREHMSNNYKDWERLGRDWSKVIIIDNIAENFALQESNGLNIKTWRGDDINDMELYDLKKILIQMYKIKVKDVRCVIKSIKQAIKLKLCDRVYDNIIIGK